MISIETIALFLLLLNVLMIAGIIMVLVDVPRLVKRAWRWLTVPRPTLDVAALRREAERDANETLAALDRQVLRTVHQRKRTDE